MSVRAEPVNVREQVLKRLRDAWVEAQPDVAEERMTFEELSDQLRRAERGPTVDERPNEYVDRVVDLQESAQLCQRRLEAARKRVREQFDKETRHGAG